MSRLLSRPPVADEAAHPWCADRRSRRWGMRAAGLLSCGILAAGGFGWAVVDHVNMGIDRVDAFTSVSNRPHDDRGLNFLLVGVDRRDGLSPQDRERLHTGVSSCNCTDTIMLLHVSRDRSRVSVVSIPRDSYVEFPSSGAASAQPARQPQPPQPPPAADDKAPAEARQAPRSFGKINAAYAKGGPSFTVQTVEKATSLHIDHYLEVNFRSFMRTVDALGGVQVCTMAELHDSYSGLNLPRGESTLNGEGALKYVRARHIDGQSDFGRIERQQHFLVQVIRQLHSSGVLMNPARLTSVVDTVLASVRADRDLRPADLVTLGTALRHLTPSGSEFTSVPVANADYRGDPGWGSSVLWDRRKAARLFAKIRNDRPLAVHRAKPSGTVVPIDPRTIRVEVTDASGRPALALKAEEQLARTGFALSGQPIGRGELRRQQTVILYDPRWDRSAASLAAALPGARLVPVQGRGPVMAVEVGSAFRGVAKVRPKTSGLMEGPDGAVTGDQVLCP